MMSEETKQLDYNGLRELADSRHIKVVEAEGLEDRCGIRFKQAGEEWVAIAPDIPESERVRALGFLLEHQPGRSKVTRGENVSMQGGKDYLYSLHCPRA